MEYIIVVILIIYFIINGVVANYMKNAAYAKGYDDNAHAFAMAFWLGLPGWLYVVALPDLIARDNQEKIIQLLANRTVNNDSGQDDLPEL